ncbi:hypothetical protein F2Q70_00007299 [Brassica cretica]|uniref:WIT1/2 N-terminal helical bundle domain-containing protein n=1 Tax=Brassica cretica TaxID=69181 RepID=A0A8S9JCS2_BRACR|nr:hypothetical protein F2Q68_00000371 [Brassica cretica]KAF2611489.1 hypothetical protein F2Q70_00007299 [Brassica cretica]
MLSVMIRISVLTRWSGEAISGLEEKLHDPEQSMHQLIDQVVEMKNQSSNFHTLSSGFDESWKLYIFLFHFMIFVELVMTDVHEFNKKYCQKFMDVWLRMLLPKCCEAPIVVCLRNLDSDVESKTPTVTTLLKSQSDSISCVIYKGDINTEIVYADRARNGDHFSSTMRFKSIHDEVPWYLADGTSIVYVEGIQKAKGFDLILGVKHIECALKVDSALAVVAVKDDRGNINIRDPLFVCQSDAEYNVAKSTEFGQSIAWDIGWMVAFVSSSVLFATESLKKFSFNETPSQVADGFDFLFQVVNFAFTSPREFLSFNSHVSFHNNFTDLMILVIVS